MDLEHIEALERLAELKRQGILTDAEVETEKNRILSAGSAPVDDAEIEDESHRPEVDQPAPPPEHPEKAGADSQPSVIEQRKVDQEPQRPEREDAPASDLGDSNKIDSAQTGSEYSPVAPASTAPPTSHRPRRVLIGALALVAIAVIGAVTITNRDSNPSPGIEGNTSAATNEKQSITTSTHAPAVVTKATTTTVLDRLSALPKAMIDGTILSPSDIDHRMFDFLPFESVPYNGGINSVMPHPAWLVPFCDGLGWMAQSLSFKDASGLALSTDWDLWQEATDHDGKVPTVSIQVTAKCRHTTVDQGLVLTYQSWCAPGAQYCRIQQPGGD